MTTVVLDITHESDCDVPAAEALVATAQAVPAETWLLRQFADALVDVGVLDDAGETLWRVDGAIDDAQAYKDGRLTAEDLRDSWAEQLREDLTGCSGCTRVISLHIGP